MGKITMEEHLKDSRPYIYSLEEFEQAQTHDPIWNAAQRQLVKEGRMHNYLVCCGRKSSPLDQNTSGCHCHIRGTQQQICLDGRDPNSYSGIMWTLGRFDRAWTERTVFGKIRYMTSDSTKRKMKLKTYLNTYGPTSRV